MVTRHIAEQEVALSAVPERPFRENAVADELREGERAPDNRLEAHIADLDAAHAWAALRLSSLTRDCPT